MPKKTFADAIYEALKQEMERDPSIILIGEDVGRAEGIFGVTRDLWKIFGEERVRDTPISEAAFIGAAGGAAICGLRPVVELMFCDFFGVAMDQIYNQLAKIRYMSGGQCRFPVVLRTTIGGGFGASAHHSQVLYSIFAHVPGIKVVVPSTPYDAKGLLIQAIRDDDFVMFFEHKMFYAFAHIEGDVPDEPYTIPFGEADVKREGRDVTVVATANMVHDSLKAAEELKDEGISVEVVDPRTLVPLDTETIVNSAKKTKRLVVADEDYIYFGVTGEIIARVVERGVPLKAPPRRVATPRVPIPCSRVLEEEVLPNKEKIKKTIKNVVFPSK